MSTFRWTPALVERSLAARPPDAPVIAPGAARPIVPGMDLWDHWPVLTEDGRLATVAGGALVIALAAPRTPDPDSRHAVARLRLLSRRAGGWRDLGRVLPDGFSPGSREWAGSATVDPTGSRLTLYFTAAGVRGETGLGYEQRLCVAGADLSVSDDAVALSGWSRPVEFVRPDGSTYQADLAGGGAVGTIKAFRDPFHFRCPGDATDRVLFTGSRAGAGSDWNGLVGLARRDGDRWTTMPPLVDATGVNNELERPHLVWRDTRAYLFWSTQAKVFAPGLNGLTGLYGLVADRLSGPWRPLNGHGLVFANPAAAPMQAYSWQVLPDLSVWSFADMVGLPGPPATIAQARSAFAGTPAPPLQLALDGDRALLVRS